MLFTRLKRYSFVQKIYLTPSPAGSKKGSFLPIIIAHISTVYTYMQFECEKGNGTIASAFESICSVPIAPFCNNDAFLYQFIEVISGS